MIETALFFVAFIILFVLALVIWDIFKWAARKAGYEILAIPVPEMSKLAMPGSQRDGPYEEYFVIGPATWALVQAEATLSLARFPDAPPENINYWKLVSDGSPPKRLRVVEIPPSQRRG
jgi:hypothetical protein